MHYKFNCIFILIFISILSPTISAPANKQAKQDQTSSPTQHNQNSNSFTPLVPGNGDQKSGPKTDDQTKSQDNGGFGKGQVFEYSYSTSHQEPQESISSIGVDKQETTLNNGANYFADHELARQALPKFFNYPDGALSDNSSDPGLSIKKFEEAFKSTASGANDNPIVANFQPSLGEEAQASYFSYAPSIPSYMRMGFSESEIDDDIEDDAIENGDLDFKSSNPKKLERSSDYNSKEGEQPEQDPKVKMVQVLMGRRNEKGKPWGTKTTLVYQDPKDANNYMQVTEVKMSVKSKKDRPETGGDEVSKVKSSFRGSRYVSQPEDFGGDFLDPNEPPEPSF